MAYADLATIQATDPGDILTAAWCDQARDNEEFLIDPPSCSVTVTSTQSITNNTITALNAAVENYDNNAMHSTVSQTSRITAQTAGRYLCIASVSYAANATNRRAALFRKNGTTDLYSTTVPTVSSGSPTDIAIARTITLAAGDYVEAMAFQDSGGSLATTLYEFAAMFLTR